MREYGIYRRRGDGPPELVSKGVIREQGQLDPPVHVKRGDFMAVLVGDEIDVPAHFTEDTTITYERQHMTHEQITAAARDPHVPTIPVADIIGPGEIRELAGGVTRKTLMTWRERPDFPKPVKSLDIGDLFDRRAVTAWLKENGR